MEIQCGTLMPDESFINLCVQTTAMTSLAYRLGHDARTREAWFYATLDRTLAEGAITQDDVLDFYRGYWSDPFEVRYEHGCFRIVNARTTR